MDKDYLKRKLRGCLLGRGVGEALGRPFIGMNDPMDLTFYDPAPGENESLCNLDFQILWMRVLRKLPVGPVADRDLFAQCWLDHVRYSENEYAVALRNLKNNIMPPWSGSFDNFYCDGFGAAHRAGLWAWLAPTKCELAAQLAYEDACVDHDSDGIYAALFIAALESAAFIENDMNKLLEIGLSFIPKDCRLAAVIADARAFCAEKNDWMEVRSALLAKYECENLTDTVMNFGFIVAALLLGEGDFERSVLIAANCAKNTAANAAIVGEILGLLNPEEIPEKWLADLPHRLVLSENIVDVEDPPPTLDVFIETLLELSEQVVLGEPLAADEPDWEQYLIPVKCGVFRKWSRLDERRTPPDMECIKTSYTFPGCFNYLDSYEVPANSLYMMEFEFKIEERKQVRVIFNTNAVSRVWLDGEFAFGRDGGWMSPSYSSVPLNQYVDVEVEAGVHTLVVGVAPNEPDENIYWVMGVAGILDRQWLPYTFFDNEEEV